MGRKAAVPPSGDWRKRAQTFKVMSSGGGTYTTDNRRASIESDVWLSPTIQTGFRRQERLQRLAEERPLTPAETESMIDAAWQQEGQLCIVVRVTKAGVVLPMDSLGLFPHGPGAAQVPPSHRKPRPEVIRSQFVPGLVK